MMRGPWATRFGGVALLTEENQENVCRRTDDESNDNGGRIMNIAEMSDVLSRVKTWKSMALYHNFHMPL